MRVFIVCVCVCVCTWMGSNADHKFEYGLRHLLSLSLFSLLTIDNNTEALVFYAYIDDLYFIKSRV